MFFSRENIEENLVRLKETAVKIELLEITGSHEIANELRLKAIYHLSKLFKQCKHKKNKEIVLEQLLWWIETHVPKILDTNSGGVGRVIHLTEDVLVEAREYSEP